MSPDAPEQTGASPLARVFCRLAREYFSGVLYAERDGAGSIFSWRDGRPVFVEALGDEPTLPDTFLEQGLITKEQYAEIATAVIEALADNEDVEFCLQAVKLGILSQAEIDGELERRLRGRIIHAIAWEDCNIEIDEDPDAVTSGPEHPQQVGPLVYTAVKTFFDEARVRALVGHQKQCYVRLLRPEREAVQFFSLDAADLELLAGLSRGASVTDAIEASPLDVLEGWQLVCALVMSETAELGSVPFVTTGRSSSQHRMPAVREDRAPSASRMPAVREERAPSVSRMPAAREERGPSQQRVPVAREERAPSASRMPVAREERSLSSSRMPAVREERGPSQQRVPVAREERAAPSQARMPVAREERAAPSQARMPAVREAATPAQPARPTSGEVFAPPTPPRSSMTRPASPANTAPVSPSLKDRPKRRKLSSALIRLNRELGHVRNEPSGPVLPVPPGATGPGRSQLEQLKRMHSAKLAEQSRLPSAPAGGADLLRSAQEALRDQQFPKAHDILKKACESEPNNEVFAMYRLYASLRAGSLSEENVPKLRLALREKVSDDIHKKFAYYALGYLSLSEKKDEAAMKFFLKATELDKANKDAERQLRILQLRKKTAEDEAKSSKIFGIEIRSKKS